MQNKKDQLIINTLEPEFFLMQKDSEAWGTSYSISTQDRVLFYGKSGSGKTSLCHNFYGIKTSKSGSIHVNNLNTINASEKQIANLRQSLISIVFQDFNLLENYTVEENIELKRCQTSSIQVNEVHEMLHRFEILHKRNVKIKNLSRGEKQRVAIVRSLCQPYSYLLLDEAFSHLDLERTRVAIEMIEESAQKNKAAILFFDLEINNYFSYSRQIKI